MKITRRLICLLLTIIMTLGCFPAMMIPANAEPVTKEITATLGEDVAVAFQYNHIFSINGTFTFSNPEMIADVSAAATVTSTGAPMSGDYRLKNGQLRVAYYGTKNVDVTLILNVTFVGSVKPGDTCEITFEYETTVEEVEAPPIPEYIYESVKITVGADYRALKAQIARAEALRDHEREYSVSSWANMRLALAGARKALLSNDQSEVDDATLELKNTIDSLVKAPIDYSALKKQIQIAEDLRKADYTSTSWSKMQTALTAARSALTSKSQETVDKATATLKKAIEELVKVTSLDFSELKRQIARAETLVESQYTPESWARMVSAWDAAKAALTATEQLVINTAASDLKVAIESLERKIELDFSELLAAIELAEALNQPDYTSASWQSLLTALDAAKEALKSPLQSEVDEAAKALKDAIANLVIMNFTALLEAIESVKKLAQTDELADLWMQMHELLTYAQELLTSGDQAAVDKCAKDIADLLLKIIEEMEKLKQVEIIEVEKEVLTHPEGDYCNVDSHRIWPILFWISLAVNVALAALIIIYLLMKRKRVNDDTPLVDYNIEDDELA